MCGQFIHVVTHGSRFLGKMTGNDVVMTLGTDSMEMYGSRLDEARAILLRGTALHPTNARLQRQLPLRRVNLRLRLRRQLRCALAAGRLPLR